VSFTSTFPTNLVKYSGGAIAAPTYISASDEAKGTELIHPARTFIDEGRGIDKLAEWLPGFLYRKRHEIIGSTFGDLHDYQIRIVVHYGSGEDSGEHVYCNEKCKPDFSDIRFTAEDGATQLPYWMEEKVDGDYAVFWVKVPYIPKYPGKTYIYVYYGNPDAEYVGSGDEVFEFFDDFEGTEIDTNKWTLERVTGGEWSTESSAYLEVADSELHYHYEGADPDHDCDKTGTNVNGWRLWSPELSIGNTGIKVVMKGRWANADWYRGHGDGLGVKISTDAGDYGYAIGYWGDYECYLYRYAQTRNPVQNLPEHSSGTATIEITYFNGTVTLKLSGTFSRSESFSATITKYQVVLLPWLGACWGDGIHIDIYYDLVYVRKYVDPEPTHGEWGAEEIFVPPLPLYVTYYFYGIDIGSGLGIIHLDRTIIETAKGTSIASILIEIRDTGTGLEVSVQLLRVLSDVSLGEEVRLSPIPLVASDTGAGVSAVPRKEMRFVKDLGFYGERSALSFLTRDLAAGIELLYFYRVVPDEAVGYELRLSPAPLTDTDLGRGLDRSLFYHLEIARSDSGAGKGIIIGRELAIADTSRGSDISAVDKIVKDLAYGASAIYMFYRVQLDEGLGEEVRLSPIPLRTSDMGAGASVAWFYHRLDVRSDEGAGAGVVAELGRTITDLAYGYGLPLVGVPTTDLGAGVDMVYEFYRPLLDAASGKEVRLSPVPLKSSDSGAGTSRQYSDRDTRVLDLAYGYGIPLLRLIQPPMVHEIETKIRTSTKLAWLEHEGRGVLMPSIGTRTEAGMAFEMRYIESIGRLYDIDLSEPGTVQLYTISEATARAESSISSEPMAQTIPTTLRPKAVPYTYIYGSMAADLDIVRFLGIDLYGYLEPSQAVKHPIAREIGIRLTYPLTPEMVVEVPSMNVVSVYDVMYPTVRGYTLLKHTLYEEVGSVAETPTREGAAITREVAEILIDALSRATRSGQFISSEMVEEMYGALQHVARGMRYLAHDVFEEAVLGLTTIISTKPMETVATVLEPVLGLSKRVAEAVKIVHTVMQEVSTTIDANILADAMKSASVVDELLGGLVPYVREVAREVLSVVEEVPASLWVGARPSGYIPLEAIDGLVPALSKELHLGVEQLAELLEPLVSIRRRVKFVTRTYRIAKLLYDLVQRMRYVKSGDAVSHRDHNLFVDFCQLFLEFAKQIYHDAFEGDMEVKEKVDALEQTVSNLRRVYALDLILPEDHNTVVEALEKMRDFVTTIRRKLGLTT